MKIMKCLLFLVIVSCFGMSLILTPLTVGFAATITPNPVSQDTKLITIKAGDTLWFLAGVYLKDPMLWGQFKQYNHFTDPDLIFPGERLLVPTTFQMPADSVRNIVDVLQKPVVSAEVIKEIQTKLEEAGVSLVSINKMVGAFEVRVGVLENISSGLRDQVKAGDDRYAKTNAKINQNTNHLNELTDKVAENQSDMQAEISSVLSQVSDLQEKLGSQQQTITAKIAADTQLIVQRVEGNQAVMSGLKQKIEAEQGPMEELSKGKRKFVALTTVLGGVVWFVVNVFGGGN